MAFLSATSADVSHLHNHHNQNGYQYSNLGLTSSLALHTPEHNPAPTQYFATYGDANTASKLPTSYIPPPSGSPFGSIAPLPRNYLAAPIASAASKQFAAPQQTPVYNQPNYQQYQQTQTRSTFQAPAYQTQQSTGSAYNQAQSQAYTQRNQEPIITKHFYVHAAPEDPEEEAGPRFVEVGKLNEFHSII